MSTFYALYCIQEGGMPMGSPRGSETVIYEYRIYCACLLTTVSVTCWNGLPAHEGLDRESHLRVWILHVSTLDLES